MQSGSEHKAKTAKGWFVRATDAEAAAVTAEQGRRHWPGRTLVFLLLLAALAGVALWVVPQLQVGAARDRLGAESQLPPGERLMLENALFQAENAARSTLALIFAAGGLLLGLGIAWRRYEISRELRTHEQFARAIEQLTSERGDGSPRIEARLGGIYALERLAADSEREYWPVMEVLTAYVRENAAWKDLERRSDDNPAAAGVRRCPPADIQAIMAVLGRRKPHAGTAERRLLDLRATDLRGANLSGSRLDGVTFHGAHLEQVDATRAILTRSNLREANFAGASMTETNLEGASLSRANLEGARLNGANLRGADLSGANLCGADLWEANLKSSNLKDADLRGSDLSQCLLEEAILWRADLQDAVINGAQLSRAHLERANLSGVTGLTWEQGEDAYTDENTILPEYLQPAQLRQTGATGVQVEAPPPTPAERRAPRRRKPAPLPAAAVVQTKDNVVELKSGAQRKAAPLLPARTLRQAQVLRQVQDERALIEEEQVHPKKASPPPKHHKPSLVKPA